MALGVLAIIYGVLIIVAITIQILLYKSKNDSVFNIFIINMLFVLVLSFLAFTSLPSNFLGQKILAASWGLMSILAIVLKLKFKQFTRVSKIMLSIALIGGIAQLFL